jgi:tetratricopeptide (TPR) repeat protein
MTKKKKATKRTRKNRPSRKPQPKQKGSNRRFPVLLGIGIILLLGFIIYSNSFDCSFHFDDEHSIVENLEIRDITDINTLWNINHTRFIPNLTFALNYHFGELNVKGYHIFNLLIHLINACLVYWLTFLICSSPALKHHTALKDKKTFALITALLFISHPLATQSVTYIVQRLASIAAMFYFLSLALYMKGRLIDKKNRSRYLLFAGALISAILAMLSKENAFTLPFAILLFEFTLFRKKVQTNKILNYKNVILLSSFLIFIAFVLFTFSFSVFEPIPIELGNTYAVTPFNYLYTQFSVIVKYIQLLILPINQNLDYDFPLSNSLFELRTILSLSALLIIMGLAIFLFKKHRIISLGIFWFFLTLSIESSIIPISDLIFEHRTYLPSFGFFIILSYCLFGLLSKKYKSASYFILAVIILSNSWLTYNRNKVWKNDLTLWNDVISKSPNKARPYGTRGDYFQDIKKYDEALADYSNALKINPSYSTAYHNRATVYKQLGQLDNAINDYTQAINIDSSYMLAFYNRGNAKLQQEKFNQAIDDFSEAIRLSPDFKVAYYARSYAYWKIQDYNEVIDDCSKAISIDPNYSQAFHLRGIAYMNLGRLNEAIADYEQALSIEPGLAGVRENLNLAKRNLGL